MPDGERPELSPDVIHAMQQSRCLFDQGQATPLASNAYVVWLDLMGAASAMSRSLPKASNFVVRIHGAALRARESTQHIGLYPINDGVYVISEDREALFQFLRRAMWVLADQFMLEDNKEHRCIVRGAIAFGRVLRGNNLAAGAHGAHQDDPYWNSVVIGMPIAHAYLAEREAPPYGFFVHESARGFAVTNASPMSYVFWKWFDTSSPEQAPKLARLRWDLEDYYEWLQRHHRSQLYAIESLSRHREAMREYFLLD